jgi:hypothetical protein
VVIFKNVCGREFLFALSYFRRIVLLAVQGCDLMDYIESYCRIFYFLIRIFRMLIDFYF